jgi:hypothetical protein
MVMGESCLAGSGLAIGAERRWTEQSEVNLAEDGFGDVDVGFDARGDGAAEGVLEWNHRRERRHGWIVDLADDGLDCVEEIGATVAGGIPGGGIEVEAAGE